MLIEDSKILKLLKIDKLITHLIGYMDTKIELTKLELEEKLRNVLTNTFHFFIIIILSVLFFLFLNIGFSLFLNQLLESKYLGFLIVSCFYLIIILFFVFDNKKRISTKITDNIFKEKDKENVE